MKLLTQRLLLSLSLPLVLGACVEQGHATKTKTSGAEDFQTYCAACHGASGKGDGAAAAGLAQKPADLTGLSKRNGGVYPATKVMAKIWGYTGGKDSHAVMPEFAALLESDLVPYDGGDGIMTPTPIRLVQISQYLRSLQ